MKLELTPKQLEHIILTMGIALDTDCRPMNEMSEKKFMEIETLHEVLVEMYNQSK
jgi:hypothetical protein